MSWYYISPGFFKVWFCNRSSPFLITSFFLSLRVIWSSWACVALRMQLIGTLLSFLSAKEKSFLYQKNFDENWMITKKQYPIAMCCNRRLYYFISMLHKIIIKFLCIYVSAERCLLKSCAFILHQKSVLRLYV